MRQYIRHPAEIPIEVSAPELPAARRRVRDVSLGGLSFESESAMRPGSVIRLRITHVEPPFESQARVVWCRAGMRGYECGVAFFSTEDAFRARMVEQICHIEQYKKKTYEAEGRALSSEDAAREWIAKHAAEFPH